MSSVVIGQNEVEAADTGSTVSSSSNPGRIKGFNEGLGVSGTTVDPPPGLGHTPAVREAESSALDAHHPSEANLRPPPSGSMTVTTLRKDESWQRYFPPTYPGSDFGVMPVSPWNPVEPALVRPSDSLRNPAKIESPSMTFTPLVEEPQEDHSQLWTENARLAAENELLKRTLGMAWDPAVASADWPSRNFETDLSMAAFYQNMWGGYPMMHPMHDMVAYGSGQWDATASRFGRARTMSDIPAKVHSAVDAPARTRDRANSANAVEDAHVDKIPDGPCTTVMLRNLPNNYTRVKLLQLIDDEGFARQYDFCYLPMDFKSHASLGYAFVNLLTPELAQQFWEKFEGFSNWSMSSQKVCSMSWSHPHQGLEAHVERYRNSPVMHEDVPEEYKPMLFKDGVLAVFPPPSKKLKAPAVSAARAGRQARNEDAEEAIES